jgi:hypothetical protein
MLDCRHSIRLLPWEGLPLARRGRVNFANTVVIRRSPHDVFEFLAEFENVPKWNYAII